LLVRGWNLLLLLLLLLLLGHIHADIPGLVQRGERKKKSMRKKNWGKRAYQSVGDKRM
jgi:hypothetical protein